MHARGETLRQHYQCRPWCWSRKWYTFLTAARSCHDEPPKDEVVPLRLGTFWARGPCAVFVGTWGSRLLLVGFAPAAVPLEDVRPVFARASSCMLICMQTTSVRIDGETHEELKRLADELGTTVGRTVTLAVRALRQDRVGKQLAQPLRADETAWLDAELG